MKAIPTTEEKPVKKGRRVPLYKDRKYMEKLKFGFIEDHNRKFDIK